MKGRIYIHRNKINGKCYVGQTIQEPEMRWMNGNAYLHKYKDGTYKQPKFANAIIKYGWDNFEHIILPDIYKNQEELDAAEIATIAKYDSFNNGYNATLGGDGNSGHKHSEETKCKISEAKKGHVVSEETREKIRLSNLNRGDNWKKKISKTLTGRKHSEETKRKISASNIGKHSMPKSPECRKKISEAGKGRKHTEEWKQMMRNRPAWNKGKQMSEETKKHYRKKILVTDTIDNTEKVYQCIGDFAKEQKLNSTYCTTRKNQHKLIKNRYYIKDLGRKYEATN